MSKMNYPAVSLMVEKLSQGINHRTQGECYAQDALPELRALLANEKKLEARVRDLEMHINALETIIATSNPRTVLL